MLAVKKICVGLRDALDVLKSISIANDGSPTVSSKTDRREFIVVGCIVVIQDSDAPVCV